MKITEQDKCDIRVSYRQAANQRKQIGILAELYATDKNVIRGILGMGPERPRSKMASPRKSVHHPVQMRIAVAMQAKERRAAGESYSKIAAEVGVDPGTVAGWVRKYAE